MPKTRKQKEESVSALSAVLKSAATVVFVGFNKLKVADERILRRGLRAQGVNYLVTKKTLLKRAFGALGELSGQIAISFGPDPIAPAKGIACSAKQLGGDHTWQTWLRDPDGNAFEIHQYTEHSMHFTGGECEITWR